MTDRELMQQALDAFELLQTDIHWEYKSPTRAMLRKIEKALRARLAQPEPYKQPEDNRLLMQAYRAIHNKQPEPEREQSYKDKPCIEDDGCPTEKAVLQRFWRKHHQPEPEPVVIDGDTSDGYHTFNELYEFRKAYNAALFNEWAASGKHSVHKSFRHHDGGLCFGGGWFIVVAVLPDGQISNHYEEKDWALFKVPVVEKALFEFDGHTGNDVIARLTSYTAPPQREWQGLTDEDKAQCIQATVERGSADELIAAIEAKLREKNSD